MAPLSIVKRSWAKQYTPRRFIMTTRMYPPWKEAATIIANSNEIFFSNKKLEQLLEEKLKTEDYNLARMCLKGCLRNEHKIDFIPWADKHLGKGYKKATSEESTVITLSRLSRKFKTAVRIQAEVIGIIKRPRLSDNATKVYDARIIQNALLRTFLAKTPLKQCIPGSSVKVDHPKSLIKRKIFYLENSDMARHVNAW